MEKIKKELEALLKNVRAENDAARSALTDTVRLTDYAPENGVWTKAFQRALDEHEVVIIPSADRPYLLDDSVIIPSNRHIIAEDGAVIKLGEGVTVLMLRNVGTVDGTHMPITGPKAAQNITISGGIWEESCTSRRGYGHTGRYDAERSLYGVSTCMFFENMDRLTLRDMRFRNCGGFAIQLGRISNVIVENIYFEHCFADGVHINGDTDNIHVRNVTGQVGDDLVAFNMYDWQNSSVNFGPLNNALCEDCVLSEDSNVRAIRLLGGMYRFDDGSEVDCSLNNVVVRNIKNIKTYKMYIQTPRYNLGTTPEYAEVGSGKNIVFEDLVIDLDSPMDGFEVYRNSDPIRGAIGAFELGMNITNLYYKNIDLTLHRDVYPYSYLLTVGPKSASVTDANGEIGEIFDPYLSSKVENVYCENIVINGERVDDITPYLREVVFDNIYEGYPSSGKGTITGIVTK